MDLIISLVIFILPNKVHNFENKNPIFVLNVFFKCTLEKYPIEATLYLKNKNKTRSNNECVRKRLPRYEIFMMTNALEKKINESLMLVILFFRLKYLIGYLFIRYNMIEQS